MTGHAKGRDENQGRETAEKAKEAGSQVADKAREVGGQAMDKAREVGSQVVDKARDAAANVGDMASHAATTVGKKADDLTAGCGTGIKNLGERLEQKGPHEGMLGQASHAVAETLKQGGHYIEDSKLSGMADDMTQFIRRNPVPVLLFGIGFGFLLGRAMRS